MPKLKKPEGKYDKLKELLHGRLYILEYNYTTLGARIYPTMVDSRNKVSRKMKNPQLMTLEELAKYARVLEIPADDLRAAIPIN